MAVSGFNRSPSEFPVGIDANALLALQNLCQQILKDLINKSTQDLTTNNRKNAERQREMNDLFFFMSEIAVLIENRQQRIAKEVYHQQVVESFELSEKEILKHEAQLKELNTAYAAYLDAENKARLNLIQEFDSRINKLRDGLNSAKENLVNQLEIINKNIAVLQANIATTNQSIRNNLQNVMQSAASNYVVNDLHLNDNVFKFTALELHDAVQDEYRNELTNGTWNHLDDEQKMERVFANLAINKMDDNNIPKSDANLQYVQDWAKVEARGYVNVMKANPEFEKLKEDSEKLQELQASLDVQVGQRVKVEDALQNVAIAHSRLEDLSENIQNLDSEMTIERANEINDEIADITESSLQAATTLEHIIRESITENTIEKIDDIFHDEISLDDFDSDSPSYADIAPNDPAPDDNNPDVPPPNYGAGDDNAPDNDYGDDLGPPASPPPNEPDPGNQQPPEYRGYGGGVPQQPSVPDGFPQPSAPSQEFEHAVHEAKEQQHEPLNPAIGAAANNAEAKAAPEQKQASTAAIFGRLNPSPAAAAAALAQSQNQSQNAAPAQPQPNNRQANAPQRAANNAPAQQEDNKVEADIPRRPANR